MFIGGAQCTYAYAYIYICICKYAYVCVFIGTHREYAALVLAIAYDQARQGLLHVDFGHLALRLQYICTWPSRVRPLTRQQITIVLYAYL